MWAGNAFVRSPPNCSRLQPEGPACERVRNLSQPAVCATTVWLSQAKIRAAAREESGIGGGGGGGGSGLQLEGPPHSNDSGSGSDGGGERPDVRRPREGRSASPDAVAAHPALPELSHAGMAAAGGPARKVARLRPTRAQQEALALSLLAADD